MEGKKMDAKAHTEALEKLLGCRPGEEKTKKQKHIRAQWELDQWFSLRDSHPIEASGHMHAHLAYAELARGPDNTRTPGGKFLSPEPDYVRRHNLGMNATSTVYSATRCMERGIVLMLKGLQTYQQGYKAQCGDGISSDYVLGPEWETIAHSLRRLLNGEIGRLDGGLTDREICQALEAAGFDPDFEGETQEQRDHRIAREHSDDGRTGK